ncbi:endonuclease/exonuclease/phosphatase family protein [Gaoshiqia sp. Z1-71]|uniref:endonuclease/exonuclease/phosphatase family protein n=1 Tax=Gaoshiqia hydrogeniformans TaxID=3290090 RepID=UPI003BF81D42
MNEWRKPKNRLDRFLLLILLFVLPVISDAQSQGAPAEYHLLFYNVENLFDVHDDPLTADDEFLPGGVRRWTYKRYQEKLNRVAKVILASCGFDLPVVIGLCEVENRQVLEDLTQKTALAAFNYRIIHKDSPDSRGIDVALLYRADLILPLEYDYLPLKGQEGKIIHTREILYAVFRFPSQDSLHVFFNHWPSRYSGQAETEPARIRAANTLKNAVDCIRANHAEPRVVIMGDFNDQPQNESLKEVLEARTEGLPGQAGELINLSAGWAPGGTLKHQQSWQIFDQVIVSGDLLKGKGLSTTKNGASMVDLPFLFEPDPRFKGKRLFRTYYGFKYQGGFSDHLPVRLKLQLND